MGEGRIRVLIADDQALFAEGLRTILESRTEDIAVVAMARDGREAIRLTAEHLPDIVLMDVRMPVLDGVEATREIHARHPDIKIMVLTTFDDDDYVRFSLGYGAIGYLLKNRPPAELIASIRAVMAGVMQIDPAVSKSLIRDVRTREIERDEFLRYLGSLTPREKEVLKLLVEACDNKQISQRMGIAEQTVRNYVSLLYSKLGIENRIDIMRHMDQIRFFLEHF
jgi:DNA-binding NarL/FixJ family response regulator